jgi:hypothetical protein
VVSILLLSKILFFGVFFFPPLFEGGGCCCNFGIGVCFLCVLYFFCLVRANALLVVELSFLVYVTSLALIPTDVLLNIVLFGSGSPSRFCP